MSQFTENKIPPFHVQIHYMHRYLNDPSRVLEYVHSPEEAADLILTTLASYDMAHSLSRETIIGAIPLKRRVRDKSIEWRLHEGTKEEVQIIIDDFRPTHKKGKKQWWIDKEDPAFMLYRHVKQDSKPAKFFKAAVISQV